MRTISIALFIFRDALSGGIRTAQWSHVALHSLWGPGWATDTLHTNTLIIAFFLLFSATFNAALKKNGLHLAKHNHKVMHLVGIIFYPFRNLDKTYLTSISNKDFMTGVKTLHLYPHCRFYSIWRGFLFINKWQASADKYHFLKQNESSRVHLFTHRHAILEISLKWHYSRDWNHHFIEQKIAIEFGAE